MGHEDGEGPFAHLGEAVAQAAAVAVVVAMLRAAAGFGLIIFETWPP